MKEIRIVSEEMRKIFRPDFCERGVNGPSKRMPQEGRKVGKVTEGGLYVAPNGMCKISTFDKEEKSRLQSFEEALREEQIIEREESI